MLSKTKSPVEQVSFFRAGPYTQQSECFYNGLVLLFIDPYIPYMICGADSCS